MRFSTNGRHFNENKSCSSTCWPNPFILIKLTTADLIQMKEHHSVRPFNFSFCSMNDALSLNNPNFGDFIHRIFSKELKIKHTTKHCKVSHILTYAERSIVKENYWPNYTTNAMTFHSVLSTFLLYVVTSLQPQRMYFSSHNSYGLPELVVTTQPCFLNLLTIKLLEQGYIATRLKTSLLKF